MRESRGAASGVPPGCLLAGLRSGGDWATRQGRPCPCCWSWRREGLEIMAGSRVGAYEHLHMHTLESGAGRLRNPAAATWCNAAGTQLRNYWGGTWNYAAWDTGEHRHMHRLGHSCTVAEGHSYWNAPTCRTRRGPQGNIRWDTAHGAVPQSPLCVPSLEGPRAQVPKAPSLSVHACM